jgi:PAS domain S-box-containing protein
MVIALYGYSEQELLSMNAFDIRISEEHSDLDRIMEKGPENALKNRIVHHRKKNGQVISVQVVIDEIRYEGEPCYLVLINDITEQLRLQKELSDERLNRQKEITIATIDGQEKQRAEMGRELHDNVNQMLASAKMYISSIRDHPAQQSDLIQRSLDTVTACMQEVRNLSRSLVLPSLGEIGLAEAVNDLIDHFQLVLTDIQFTTHIFINEDKLVEGLKISLYRIIQEQLSNILKYAEASRVFLKLNQDGEVLHLVITDDGKGFDTTQKRKGIGITNMITRAEVYNGRVQITSSPGNGCTLNVSFDVGK